MIDALAGGVVHPPMVGTAEPFLLGDAVLQINAAVSAALGDESQASLPIAEESERLAEQTDGPDGVFLKLLAGGNGKPITAK